MKKNINFAPSITEEIKTIVAMTNHPKTHVNVREVLHNKAPKAKVPGFVLRYLEHIVHQKEINEFLSQQGHLYGIDFVRAVVDYFQLQISTQGLDDLPDGRYTFAGNHPLGAIDGLSTGLAVYDKYPERGIKFLSNDILTGIANLRPLFIPVNKVGNQSQKRSLPERLNEAYASEEQMVIFPAGLCARRIKGEVTELAWQKSFIQKSVEFKRDVVPVWFEGKNSNFFYNLANLRTALGIKINIEMLYLADELFKQKSKVFHIIYGKPIPWQHFDAGKSHQDWAAWVREQAIALRHKPA